MDFFTAYSVLHEYKVHQIKLWTAKNPKPNKLECSQLTPSVNEWFAKEGKGGLFQIIALENQFRKRVTYRVLSWSYIAADQRNIIKVLPGIRAWNWKWRA